MHLLSKLHARLGDFWWYSLLLFAALRCGDLINAFVGLWLVPKYVPQEELGAVLPLTQFASAVGAPMAILVMVFTKFLNKFKTLGEDGKVKSMLLWFIGFSVMLTVVSSAVAIAILPHFFERIRVTSGSLTVLIIAVGLIGTITPVFTNALQGLKRFHAVSLINLLAAPVRLITMVIAMPFRALSGYMVGQLMPQLFTIASSCFVMRRHLHRSVKATPFWKSDGLDIAKYTGLVSLWVGVGAICSPITFMIIRQRLTDIESSAYYMISRFAELSTYAGQTLVFVMLPLVAEASVKSKNSSKLLLMTDFGTVAFGLIVSAALYFISPYVFNSISTCQPYVAYIPDLVLLSITLTIGLVWTNFTTHEMARGNFWYLTYGTAFTILQAAVLVCFTGYNFFKGILPDSVICWMASLKIDTLRGFLWAQLSFNIARVVSSYIHLIIINRRNLVHQSQ